MFLIIMKIFLRDNDDDSINEDEIPVVDIEPEEIKELPSIEVNAPDIKDNFVTSKKKEKQNKRKKRKYGEKR